MSLVESPTSVDCVHQRSGTTATSTTAVATAAAVTDHYHHQYHHHHHRLSSKRKFDEYGPTFDEDEEYVDFSDSVSIRMRKVEPNAVDCSSNGEGEGPSNHLDARVSDARSASFSCSARPEWTRSPSRLQFFVRMISEGNTLVIHAQASDTVKSLHERIQAITGIPVFEQRLIYRGKQLQWEQSLAACSIQNDAGLQLVGRLRSTEHPQAWQIVDDIVSMVCRLCRGEMIPSASKTIKGRMTEYLDLATKDVDLANGKLQIFMSSHAPAALVMLYLSGIEGNKDCADSSIKHFLSSIRNSVPKLVHTHCAPIVLEFCKLLRSASDDDPLYTCCRSTLGYLLETVGVSRRLKNLENGRGLVMVQEILPFVSELGKKLSSYLVSSMQSPTSIGPLVTDVCDFTAFVLPLRTAILEQLGERCPVSDPSKEGGCKHPLFGEELDFLSHIFLDLLKKMDDCLHKMETNLADRGKGVGDIYPIGWSQYLAILKELNSISELYKDGDEKLWSVMRVRKASLCSLIIRFSKRADDHGWILEHKDVLDFESRRHLVMMMFPEVKEDYEELHEMLIDRSHLLAESFEYIAHAEPVLLHAGLFMEFKNEEATGPGVLREWFFLVCQALFNPQNALFVPCPNDRRRFFPNPASKVDPLHLEYFTFSGRVIALALMHKVQVGVVFDRVFFLQLAGGRISLEDTHDADPCLYNSCKQILQMDAEFIDSDALGLTFVTEVEELGSRKVVELLQGGKSIIVNSKNREEYVKLLIQHRFVTSISEQVSHFAQGFADMLCNSKQQKFFFQSLKLEDFDWMLHGSESAICVGDWKAHTEYCGFKETDPQILWFWKIVGEMSAEQRKVLLFFWTSVKYLPVEGFHGLASRLSIYKTVEPYDHLPSSHTCFYRLCFPPYPSMAVMKDRLQIITQEHVGCSFGTW